MIMKEEAESLKETLVTKNKMLRVESDKFKRTSEKIEKQSKAREGL